MRTLNPPAETKPWRPADRIRSAAQAPRVGINPRPSAAPSEHRWNLAFLGLLALLFIQYTSLPLMFPQLQPFHLAKVAVAVAVLGLLISPQSRRPAPAAVRWMDVCLVAFLLVTLVSACLAEYTVPAWAQFVDTLQWCAVYFLISRVAGKRWQLYLVICLLMLLNLKLAQFSIRSFHSAQAAGVSAHSLAVHGEGAGSTAFFGNAGDFGVAMCVVWPIAGAMIIAEVKKWRKWFFTICFLAFLGAIVVSSSRGALVGAALIALAGVMRSSKRAAGLLMLLLVAAAYLAIVPGASKERMESALHPEQDKTAADRLNLWHAGMAMFYAHPLLGVGPGNFGRHYLADHPMPARRKKLMAWVPHSIYIQALSELGIAGFVPLLSVWALVAALNARTRKLLRVRGEEKTRRFEYNLSWGLDLALVGYLVSGAFITVLYYPHLWVILGLTAALYSAVATEQGEVGRAAVETRMARNFRKTMGASA